MLLVNLMMMMPKRRPLTLVLFALPFFSMSQENSPYSRYGIGNLVPSGNILSRGMGGISAGFSDPTTINFLNPASYSNLVYTTFDIGAQFDSRSIKSSNPPSTFTSNNAIISYLQFGFPLLNGNKKALKKNISWGLNFGLRPVSKINYKIEKDSRLPNIDSLQTIYEGTGGVNEAFVGTGVRIKNLSFGVNAGYTFGNKDYSTRLTFINDTVNYLKSNSASNTNFGGVFLQGGIQYSIEINKNSKDLNKRGIFRIGAYGKLQQNANGSQDLLRETFVYNSTTGNPDRLDSVSEISGIKGKVVLPASFGIGFTVERIHLLYGADFEMTNWNNYSFYGQPDLVKNTWMAKAGVQYYPATSSRKYWNYVKYRAGVYFGPDYITADKTLPQYGITLGGGFPLKIKRGFYETQYSVMNVSLEYGSRGNTNNNIRENIFRIGVGFALSDIWFIRQKYQ